MAVLAGYESERVLPSGHTYRVFTENIDEEDHTNYVAMIFHVVRPHELSGRIFRLHNCLFYNLDDLPLRYYIGKTYAFDYTDKPVTSVLASGGIKVPASIWQSAPISAKDMITVGWGEVRIPTRGTRHRWTRDELAEDMGDLKHQHELLEKTIGHAEKIINDYTDEELAFPKLPTIGKWGKLNPYIVKNAIAENILSKNEQEQFRLRQFKSTIGDSNLQVGEDSFLVAAVAGYEKERILPSGDVYHCYVEDLCGEDTNCVAVIFYVVHPPKLAGRVFRVINCAGINDDLPIKYETGIAYDFKFSNKPNDVKILSGTQGMLAQPITLKQLMPIEWSDNQKMSVYGKFGLREYLTSGEVQEDLDKLKREHKMLEDTMWQAESNKVSGVKLAVPDEGGGLRKRSPHSVCAYIKKYRLPRNEQDQHKLEERLKMLEKKEAENVR